MVRVKQKFPIFADGSIDITTWLGLHFASYSESSIALVRDACEFSQFSFTDNATFYGQLCFEQGLECAEVLAKLKADTVTISAAIIYCSKQGADIDIEDIEENSNNSTAQLIQSVERMRAISTLHEQTNRNSGQQIDNLRKMLLAMVQDVRTVLITLAMRLCIMRGIQVLGHDERRSYAEETMDIYAPLANRLGLSALKWELEDLSFHDLNPSTYKLLGQALNEKRVDREARVKNAIELLTNKSKALGINAEVQGRAKHLYSIYKKMQRKGVPFEEVYDTHAVRIIVETIDECYKALGIVHDYWSPITEEFDDYIATPKSNGYQSIHTAVTDQDGKYLEIQIRTKKMHQENELGVAAHWMYKEGVKSNADSHEAKVSWLRELLEWHKQLGHKDEALDRFHDRVFEERIYVFTPNGDIVDLAENATPLDFAYHIHSGVGHRCRGAKVNGKMVPLSYHLNTGDNVEIIKAKEPGPSRDWMNPESGYLSTAKARAKVHQWFRKQDLDKNIVEGRQIIDKELHRIGSPDVSLDKIANHLNAKNTEQLYVGIACGNLRTSQFLHALHQLYPQVKIPEKPSKIINKTYHANSAHLPNIRIQGVSNLLTHIAKCCKPIPGEEIVGYITQGKGVSIHRRSCLNIENLSTLGEARLLDASWEGERASSHIVELLIETKEPADVSIALAQILTQEKTQVLQIQEKHHTKTEHAGLLCAIRVDNISSLNKLVDKIKQIPMVQTIRRT